MRAGKPEEGGPGKLCGRVLALWERLTIAVQWRLDLVYSIAGGGRCNANLNSGSLDIAFVLEPVNPAWRYYLELSWSPVAGMGDVVPICALFKPGRKATPPSRPPAAAA